MFDRGWEKQTVAKALAAAGSFVDYFYFPRAVRVIAYFAVPSVAEAAHATQAVAVTFNNRGVDGLGNTVLATITNENDLTNTTTRKVSAFVAKDAIELVTSTRPDGSNGQYDSIPAGAVVEVGVTKAAGTQTGDVVAGMYGFYSS